MDERLGGQSQAVAVAVAGLEGDRLADLRGECCSGLLVDKCNRLALPSGLPLLAASWPSVSTSRPTASGATLAAGSSATATSQVCQQFWKRHLAERNTYGTTPKNHVSMPCCRPLSRSSR